MIAWILHNFANACTNVAQNASKEDARTRETYVGSTWNCDAGKGDGTVGERVQLSAFNSPVTTARLRMIGKSCGELQGYLVLLRSRRAA